MSLAFYRDISFKTFFLAVLRCCEDEYLLDGACIVASQVLSVTPLFFKRPPLIFLCIHLPLIYNRTKSTKCMLCIFSIFSAVLGLVFCFGGFEGIYCFILYQEIIDFLCILFHDFVFIAQVVPECGTHYCYYCLNLPYTSARLYLMLCQPI